MFVSIKMAYLVNLNDLQKMFRNYNLINNILNVNNK